MVVAVEEVMDGETIRVATFLGDSSRAWQSQRGILGADVGFLL